MELHPDLANRQTTELAWQIPIAAYIVLRLLMMSSTTCRVLYIYIKKNWKIAQLVGIIIRIYHDAQSSKCQTSIQSWLFISVCPDCHIKARYDGKTPWQDEILLFEVHLMHTALSACCHTVHAATVRRSSHTWLAELFAFNWWGMQCVSDNVLLFHVHGYISQLHIT
jgi:hypothetical protein